MAADGGDFSGATVMMTADDGTLPLRPGETARDVLAQRRDLELHSYYGEIEQLTFPTSFVPVDVETARAWRIYNRGGDLSPEDARRMGSLRERIELEVRRFVDGGGNGSGRAFVRLSTRSPKDAVDSVPALRAKLVTMLRQRLAPEQSNDPNMRLSVLQDCFGELMSVTSAEEALDLIQFSSRCVSDLVRMLDYYDDLPCWDLQVIVREFVPCPASSEYRCFVFGGKLTAASQYFAHTYYPETDADDIGRRIQAFFAERCASAISLDSYILDLAVLPGTSKVWIIELNPFARSTGACLFDWEADATVLEGNGPFEIRVVESAKAHLDAWLLPWSDVFAEACEETKEERNGTGGGACAVS